MNWGREGRKGGEGSWGEVEGLGSRLGGAMEPEGVLRRRGDGFLEPKRSEMLD